MSGIKVVGVNWLDKADAVIAASRKVRATQFEGEPCEAGKEDTGCPYCAMDDLTEALDALDEEES